MLVSQIVFIFKGKTDLQGVYFDGNEYDNDLLGRSLKVVV